MRIQPTKLLTILFVIVSLCSCTRNGQPTTPETTPSPSPTPTTAALDTDDVEILRAADYGFVPETLLGDWESPVSYQEFAALLGGMIQLYDPELMGEWQTKAAKLYASTDAMTRAGGALTLFMAAEVMGIESIGYTDADFEATYSIVLDGDWQHMDYKAELFSDPEEVIRWQGSPDPEPMEFNRGACSVFYCIFKLSKVSGKSLLDFDLTNSSEHLYLANPMTRTDAIHAVLRLYESTFNPIAEENAGILAEAATRRNEILNTADKIVKAETRIMGETYTGTAYYISENGDDVRDGLSPETAWQSLARLRQADLQYGDAVFFERGGIFRGYFNCVDGVTYAAYGQGSKPVLTFSPENGSGAEKWSLYAEDGEKRIWVFYKDLEDAGTVVLNDGQAETIKIYAFWDGSQYTDVLDHSISFDVNEQLYQNLTFFSEADSSLPSELPIDLQFSSKGKLYLRSDEGNPGELYSSIEFAATQFENGGSNDIIAAGDTKDVVLDNLSVKYGYTGVTFTDGENILMQNCEVAFMGGQVFRYDTDMNVSANLQGDGICVQSKGSTVRGNYVHDIFDVCITLEVLDDHKNSPSDLLIEENLTERCGEADAGIVNRRADDTVTFSNIRYNNNIFMYDETGYGIDQRLSKQLSGSGVVTFMRSENPNDGIYFTNNTFYVGKSGLVTAYSTMFEKNPPHFSGNTYYQYRQSPLLVIGPVIRFWDENAADAIREVLGDTDATVLYAP